MPKKVATRSSLEQVAILDSMLRRGGVTMQQMAEAIGAHERTVRRHIDWMRRKFELRIIRQTYINGHPTWSYPYEEKCIFTEEALRCLAR